MENQPLDILSELASSAAAQEQQQEQEPISDQAFQALLLASLNEPAASTNQQLHFITQHQHAQDLLSAPSALQTKPSSSLTQIEPFQPSQQQQQQQQSQDELDFDDPNLFSPFDPEHHHHHLQQDPVSLTDQIDLLFGSSQPSTSSARKVYSNSFSFQQQQQQQQSEQQQEQDLHQLDLYHHLPLNDHHEFNILFNPDYHLQQQPNPPPDQSNPEFNTEDAYDMMNGLDDDLLDRLDNGLINNSNHEEFKLNELDSKIENSIELNQSYSNHIKATLDHPNTLHDKAQKFQVLNKFDHKNWDLISNELATGRTASECVKQLRILTQEKQEWSEQDDLLLKEGVSTYGQNWQAVANHCGRSSNECINQWSKTLRPDIKKGKWDPIKDEALKSAVTACGMVWKDVAPCLRGRTDTWCRERWCNILNPRIVVGNWTPEEDQKILRRRDVERKTWLRISKSFH
ncbi:hypothetical protein H4Q26_013383 [Puccinia striiformis f. sp. tritici PST-130]|nr:hypothetical protein H4Q26_013383 [Puccinia striiformis f. sp. tritici PST-130]